VLPEIDKSPTADAPVQQVTVTQMALVVAIIAGYAGLSYYSATAPEARGLALLISLAPIALIGVAMAWRWHGPLLAALITTATGALLLHYWAVLKQYFEWTDLIQQCGVYAFVSYGFGRTLFAGRVPLCTQLFTRLHGPPSPTEASYTRRATVAWALFYLLLTLAILVLFFAAPLGIWSAFVNFGSFGLICIMFLTDHAIRGRVLSHRPGGVLAAIRQSLTGSR
jgi:uncharacterized membrane protein